jgi:selenocysteine lyase/cysteine desulfurase
VSYKRLFSRAIAANPERLHFAAHSHHLWPDANYDGHMEAWEVAARRADTKWDEVMGPVWDEGQAHTARELGLPDPATITFSANTHDFILRLFSALPHPARVLATDGEFHSFRRQMARWAEDGDVILETAAPDALAARAEAGGFDLIFASHVLFNTGALLPDIDRLASLAKPEGPWVMLDCYHSFMAIPCDFSTVADRVFLTGGAYKYAMAGEGLGWLHAPPGFAPRPAATGWFAEFDDLMAAPGATGYHIDARRFLGATFDPTGLYRFNAVRRMLDREGLTTATICDHVARLQHRFVNRANMPGMTLLNPLENAPHARFLAYHGPAAPGLFAQLLERNIVTDLRGETLRIGFGLYHDNPDVDRMAEVVSSLTATQGA